MRDPNRKPREMRNAIDMIEGALMGAGELIDIPGRFEGARDDLLLMPKITLGQLRRIRKALSECTRITASYFFVFSSSATCCTGTVWPYSAFSTLPPHLFRSPILTQRSANLPLERNSAFPPAGIVLIIAISAAAVPEPAIVSTGALV